MSYPVPATWHLEMIRNIPMSNIYYIIWVMWVAIESINYVKSDIFLKSIENFYSGHFFLVTSHPNAESTLTHTLPSATSELSTTSTKKEKRPRCLLSQLSQRLRQGI